MNRALSVCAVLAASVAPLLAGDLTPAEKASGWRMLFDGETDMLEALNSLVHRDV